MTDEDFATVNAYTDALAGIAVRDALRVARAAILAMAARQESFASPDYTQCTDADRAMFRHVANVLRAAADLLKPPVTK